MNLPVRVECRRPVRSAWIFFLSALFALDAAAQINIVTEDFEGAWPAGDWTVLPPVNGCAWGRTDIDADTGGWSVSPASGDSCPGDPAGPYQQNANSWMYFGPFSLADAVTAQMTFRYKIETESAVDILFAGHSTVEAMGVTAPFFASGGTYTWTDGVVNLDSLAGESEVWVYFIFDSDGAATEDRGVLVDNISIDKDTTLPTFDLALQSVDAADGVHVPGAQLGVPAVIENVSVENAPAYSVHFYISNDTTITEADTSLGFFARPALPAGQTSNLNALLTLPNDVPDGDYYIGAIIELVDASAANNVNHDATPITVTDDPAIRVRPSTLTFVENGGAGPAAASSAEAASAVGLAERQATAAILPELRARGAAEGEVRVIVGLEMDFTVEARLGASAAAAQRATIESRQQALLDDLLGLGIEERARYRFIPYVALSVSPAALDRLAASPLVRSIEEDRLNRPYMASSNIVIGSPLAWAEGYDGGGQAVAVLDTGTDLDHPWFTTGGSKIVSEACYSSNGMNQNTVCPGGVESSTSPGSGADCDAGIDGCDHGTHVAGTAVGNDGSGPDYGVARGADLISMQVFSEVTDLNRCSPDPTPCSRNSTSDLILALERVLTLSASFDIAAVNMSLGGGQYFSQAACNAANPSVKAAIDNLRAAGIASIIAAGNDGFTDSIGSPACISSAISVGATTDDDAVASFSNIYPQIHLLAPGTMIDSAVPGGGVDVKQGTSMATPHVAGAWAVLRQMSPGSSVDDILAVLQNAATPVDDQRQGGVETDMPRINLDLALGANRTTFGIFNDGPGTLNVTSIVPQTAAPWIGIDPTGPFDVPAGQLQVVEISIDYGSAPAGNSVTRLLINSNDPDDSPWPGGVFIDVTSAGGDPEVIHADGFEDP